MLPATFLDRPIAHRALHGPGRPENSREAIEAAAQQGFGIEIDIQPSGNGVPMVFHDYDLGRLTGHAGPVAKTTSADLGALTLLGGASGIPTLPEVLTIVAGRVPLLIEIKDQDGAMGPNVGPLERAVAAAVQGYDGPVAWMSFNPHSVAALRDAAPEIPRGLTTSSFPAEKWPLLPETRRAELRTIPDAEATGACFISHAWQDLGDAAVAKMQAKGLPILCWTIKSAAEEAQARRIAQNVTFEGYLPA